VTLIVCTTRSFCVWETQRAGGVRSWVLAEILFFRTAKKFDEITRIIWKTKQNLEIWPFLKTPRWKKLRNWILPIEKYSALSLHKKWEDTAWISKSWQHNTHTNKRESLPKMSEYVGWDSPLPRQGTQSVLFSHTRIIILCITWSIMTLTMSEYIEVY